MSFVFVSHASDDKSKIRHIVDALIAAGLKIWLDNPQHRGLGYTVDEISRHFHRIRAGGRWRDEIDEALKSAGAIVVCWSERALEDTERRFVWLSEAEYARKTGKLVACRIDDVSTGKLKHGFGEVHAFDLRRDLPPESGASTGFFGRSRRIARPRADLDTNLQLLVADVRVRMGGSARSGLDRRAQRDPFAPYLVDRERQECDIAEAVEEIDEGGGVRPFIITAPDNECLEEFILRLERHAMPRTLKGRSWHRVTVEWPDASAGDFAVQYKKRLAAALRIPMRSTDSEIARTLARIDRPVVCETLMLAEEWSAEEPERISSWLAWWDDLAKSADAFKALPILSLKMPPLKPGWRGVPPGTARGAAKSNAAIWREVQRLAKSERGVSLFSFFRTSKPVPVVGAPPVLHPVDWGHVERWMNDHFKPLSADRDEIEPVVRSLFADDKARAAGMALDDFAAAMKPLFRDK